jgi:hypothetical protein
MKIHLITTYYQPFIQNFLKRNGDLSQMTYSEMLQMVLNEFFADTGSSYYWFKQKKCEAFISIGNFEVLQKKWAQENNVSFSENWKFEILAAQIKQFKADVLYNDNIFEFDGDFLSEFKPEIKKMVAWISCPFNEATLNIKNIDLVLSSTKNYVNSFNKAGVKADYMLPAFDSRVLKSLTNKKDIDFSFVGGISEDHINRFEALNVLSKKTDLKIWGYGLKEKVVGFKNLIFGEKDIYKNIRPIHMGEAWGLEMFKVLNRSKITFNIHEALLKGDVGNMRMFEATGCGTLLLNDNGNNLKEIFEPGKEIEVYNNINEALEKVNYYLKHPEKANEIVLNGQKKTIEKYNYQNYVNTQLHFFERIN